MIVIFENEYLRELYTAGVCRDRKRRFPPDVIKRYQKAITYLVNASSIEALWPIHSLHYKVLQGDKAGISSIRVNDQYRIEFTVTMDAENPILTICNIQELSNHYE